MLEGFHTFQVVQDFVNSMGLRDLESIFHSFVWCFCGRRQWWKETCCETRIQILRFSFYSRTATSFCWQKSMAGLSSLLQGVPQGNHRIFNTCAKQKYLIKKRNKHHIFLRNNHHHLSNLHFSYVFSFLWGFLVTKQVDLWKRSFHSIISHPIILVDY